MMAFLKNRTAACLLTALLIAAGIFTGSQTTYFQLRRPVVQAFNDEIVPLLNEQIQMVYNMQTIYELNGGQVMNERVLNQIELLRRDMNRIHNTDTHSSSLYTIADDIFQAAGGLNLNENDARFMRGFMSDLTEMQMILRQSQYNRLAADFNNAAENGLGLLTGTWRLFPQFGVQTGD